MLKKKKLKGRDSTMKFSSLKIPGKLKTDNDLNIRRKLKVIVSLQLLIIYNTLSLRHLQYSALNELQTCCVFNIPSASTSFHPTDSQHKDSGLPQPSTSMANTNAVLCFVLLWTGGGRGLVRLRTRVRNKDSHYRTVFSVRASGSSSPDHDHPLRWEGLGEFRAQRSRVQVTSTPRLAAQHSCSVPACGFVSPPGPCGLCGAGCGRLDLFLKPWASPGAFWASPHPQHLPLQISIRSPV